MSAPYYGDTAQDPQDAGKEERIDRDITAGQAEDYFDPGTPLPAAPAPSWDWMQKFCSKDETRVSLLKPFAQAGYLWASDGKIIIRGPLPKSFVNDANVNFPNAAKCFDFYKPTDWQEWDITLPEGAGENRSCTDCEGCGWVTCPTCDHQHECEDCDGTGSIRDPQNIKWNGKTFSDFYLAKIQKLDRPEICLSACNTSMMFRSLDAIGVIKEVFIYGKDAA